MSLVTLTLAIPVLAAAAESLGADGFLAAYEVREVTDAYLADRQSVDGSISGVCLRVAAIDGVATASVEVTWDPPWDPEMMSEAAKLEL